MSSGEPVWIDRVVVLRIHEALLVRFGGPAGIRDEAMLDSALHRPRQQHAYGKPDLFDLAAAYAAGIVRNHPFLDGNKRTGFLMAALFLELNGIAFTAPEEQAVIATRGLAAGEIDEDGYARWLRDAHGYGAVEKPNG